MKTLATALCILVLTTTATATPYGPVVGVSAIVGVASGQNQPTFQSTTSFSSVTVTVVDDSGFDTYFTICVELTGNSLCSTSDPQGADLQASGINTVTLDVGSLPAGTTVTAFIYTLYVDRAGAVAIGTTGNADAAFN